MHPMRRYLPLLITVLTLALATSAMACPFCKDSIPNSDAQSGGGVPTGFNDSIFLMLGGMLAVLGFVMFTLVKAARSTLPPRQRGFPLRQYD